jgi:RNA polymerase sigma factor (sigma-70 family)
MGDRRQDFDRLQRFTREGEESAFADLVRRHQDLVFATALRKVEDSGVAQEVTQNVFAALARKAWQFGPDDSLPAWLHKAALLESMSWLRGELSRRRRVQTAIELGTTMNPPENQAAFQALIPLLDEGLLSLREKDRTALLLRFCEGQSLREVGAAFGVSEDTAQKRVQAALEKLAAFFRRRGFKTATVAAAAAALQSTVISTSATAVGAIVSVALQAAPPAPGLTALLARLASLSRAQTAALCVALATLPMGWQLKERHGAAEEAKQIQTQLFAAQRNLTAALSGLERTQANFDRLQQNAAQQKEEADRATESALAFELWKQKTRDQLLAADYPWDEDSPFVRIPKAILPELSEFAGAEPFSVSGVVNPFASELLGLTPAERGAVEDVLRRHSADLNHGREAGIYETNRTSAAGESARSFVLPAVTADEVKERGDRMLAELRGVLGEERWPLVEIRLHREKTRHPDSVTDDLPTLLDLSAAKSAEELSVTVSTDATGTPTYVATCSSHGLVGFWNGVLSTFLPEGDPRRTSASGEFGAGLSHGLRQRAMTWLEEQAAARLGAKEKP